MENSNAIHCQTGPLRRVNQNGQSVLPTGALRLRGATLEQELSIIVHNGPVNGRPQGFYESVWEPVDPSLLAAIHATADSAKPPVADGAPREF